MKCILCASPLEAAVQQLAVVVCSACCQRIAELRVGRSFAEEMEAAYTSYGFMWHRFNAPATFVRTSSELRAYEARACGALITFAAQLAERGRARFSREK